MLAEKANTPVGSATPPEDDEEPAWSGIIHNQGDDSPAGDELTIDRVLRIIPGEIVS